MLKPHFFRTAGIATVLVLLAGCATSGFEKFYNALPGSETVASNPMYEKPPTTPKLYMYSSDPKSDAKHLAEDGYVMIGTSSFFGPSKNGKQSLAIEQGKKVGAAVVMLNSTYKDTLTGAIPYTVQNPNQTATVSTNGTVNSFGSGGYANGTYNSTSTVSMPGGSTTYNIPYAISRSDIFASYWVARDPAKMRLGTNPVNLPDNIRTRLGRNTGAYIAIVIRGTPAFRANVLEGDVIVKINDLDVIDAKGFSEQLTQFAGQSVKLSIIRGAEPISIQLTLNENPPGLKL
jgi:PDZ domain